MIWACHYWIIVKCITKQTISPRGGVILGDKVPWSDFPQQKIKISIISLIRIARTFYIFTLFLCVHRRVTQLSIKLENHVISFAPVPDSIMFRILQPCSSDSETISYCDHKNAATRRLTQGQRAKFKPLQCGRPLGTSW